MPNYTLNRNYTLRTVDGVISFEKGEPTWVPPNMEKHALSIGAEPVEPTDTTVLGDEPEQKPELDDDDRKELILTALKEIEAGNVTSNFTGAGVPTVKAVEKITGFDVDRSEVAELWAAYNAGKSEQ